MAGPWRLLALSPPLESQKSTSSRSVRWQELSRRKDFRPGRGKRDAAPQAGPVSTAVHVPGGRSSNRLPGRPGERFDPVARTLIVLRSTTAHRSSARHESEATLTASPGSLQALTNRMASSRLAWVSQRIAPKRARSSPMPPTLARPGEQPASTARMTSDGRRNFQTSVHGGSVEAGDPSPAPPFQGSGVTAGSG